MLRLESMMTMKAVDAKVKILKNKNTFILWSRSRHSRACSLTPCLLLSSHLAPMTQSLELKLKICPSHFAYVTLTSS